MYREGIHGKRPFHAQRVSAGPDRARGELERDRP